MIEKSNLFIWRPVQVHNLPIPVQVTPGEKTTSNEATLVLFAKKNKGAGELHINSIIIIYLWVVVFMESSTSGKKKTSATSLNFLEEPPNIP